MGVYTVHGYQRTVVMMKVEAETEEEAIAKARAGEYTNADTEPGGWLYSPKWTATEGWHLGNYQP